MTERPVKVRDRERRAADQHGAWSRAKLKREQEAAAEREAELVRDEQARLKAECMARIAAREAAC